MYLESLTANEYYRHPAEPGLVVIVVLVLYGKAASPGSAQNPPWVTGFGLDLRLKPTGMRNPLLPLPEPVCSLSRRLGWLFDCCCVPVCKMKMTLCGFLFSVRHTCFLILTLSRAKAKFKLTSANSSLFIQFHVAHSHKSPWSFLAPCLT